MSLNKVMLIGNVGNDPDVRYVDKDVAVATFPLYTTERGYRLPNGTEVPDRTEWHNIVLWRGLAEVASKYVHKGDKLFLEGKIKTRSYDDRNGMKRYITEIFADSMEMLTPKPASVATQPAASAAAEATQKMSPIAGAGNADETLPF